MEVSTIYRLLVFTIPYLYLNRAWLCDNCKVKKNYPWNLKCIILDHTSVNYALTAAWEYQHCHMCDHQSLRSACAYTRSDQGLCISPVNFMTLWLLIEHHLEFLSLKWATQACLSINLSKWHTVGNHMSRLISQQKVFFISWSWI